MGGEHRYGCGYLAPCFCAAAAVGLPSFFFFAPRLSFTSGFTFWQLFRLWLFNSLAKVDGGFGDPIRVAIPIEKSRHRAAPRVLSISDVDSSPIQFYIFLRFPIFVFFSVFWMSICGRQEHEQSPPYVARWQAPYGKQADTEKKTKLTFSEDISVECR